MYVKATCVTSHRKTKTETKNEAARYDGDECEEDFEKTHRVDLRIYNNNNNNNNNGLLTVFPRGGSSPINTTLKLS